MRWCTMIAALFFFLDSFSQSPTFYIHLNPGIETPASLMYHKGEGGVLSVGHVRSLSSQKNVGLKNVQFIYYRGWWDQHSKNHWAVGGKLEKAGGAQSSHWLGKAELSLVFAKRLSSRRSWHHHLSIGSSLARNFFMLNQRNYWFGTQYNLEKQYVDRTLPNLENPGLLEFENFSTTTFTAGIAWWAKSRINGDSWTAGIDWEYIGQHFGTQEVPLQAFDNIKWTGHLSWNRFFRKDIAMVSSMTFESHSPFLAIAPRMGLLSRLSSVEESLWLQVSGTLLMTEHTYGFGLTFIRIATDVQINKLGWSVFYGIPVGGLADKRLTGNMGVKLVYRPGASPPLTWR